MAKLKFNLMIVRGFAHRYMSNGTVESATINVAENGTITVNNDWAPRPAEAMNLSGGDSDRILNDLQLYSHFLNAEYELPHAEPPSSSVKETRPV